MNYRSLSTPDLVSKGGPARVAEAQYRLDNWEMKKSTVVKLQLFVSNSKAKVTQTKVVTILGKSSAQDHRPKKAKATKATCAKAPAKVVSAVKPQDRPYGTKTGDEIVALLAQGDPDAIAEAVDYRSTPTVKAALKAVLAGGPIPEKPVKAPTIRNASGTVVDRDEAALKVKANVAYAAVQADAPDGHKRKHAKAAYAAVMNGSSISDAITDGLRQAVEAFEAATV